MKKRILLLAFVFALCCTLVLPITATASALKAYTLSDYRYFEYYDVHIKVQENNVLDVTEMIVCDYDVLDTYGHGIIRSIPTSLKFTFPDGSKRTFRIVVSDIKVPGQKFTKSVNGDYIDLKIGDPDKYATGKVNYVIEYKYDIGYDYYDASDFLYYNIIGAEWNADIKNASFTVEMPKSFDKDKVAAYQGKYGSKTPVELSISGNTITGKAQNLGPKQGITLAMDLPEGYFTDVRKGMPYALLLYGVCALVAVSSVVLFLLFGRDKKEVQTVEFRAPDDLTPAEVGYIIDGCVDNKDVTSLIIYWADKGYLTLAEKEDKDILIEKKRDLPEDAKQFEQTMFQALFKEGDSISVSSLKYTFYSTMETVKLQVKQSFVLRRIFTSLSLKLQGLLGFLTALPITLSFFFAAQYYTGNFVLAAIFSALVLGFILGPVYGLIALVKSWRSLENRKRIIRMVLCLVLLGVVLFLYFAVMTFLFDALTLSVASIASTSVAALCTMVMRKRTDLGTKYLGQILGLKNFIEKAEKDRIEKLVESDPNYFYSILPYAYVLGVTDRWAKNFEKIGIQPPPPVWYNGYYRGDMFTTMVFLHSFNHSMHSMNTSFVSRPAPQGGTSGGFGGGGFSGGGFSGGGFGGGGGGGW